MKIQKKTIVLLLVLMLVVVGLSGCTQLSWPPNLDSKLTGTWTYTYESFGGLSTETITFFSDGKCSYPFVGVVQISGNYEIKDGNLVITIELQGETGYIYTYDYYFSDNNLKLYLTEVGTGATKIYIKQ